MAMLKHLYGSDYRDQDPYDDGAHPPGLHLSVFMLGDKYDISSLRDDAAQCFTDFIQEEELSDYYFPETIYAIQKLLGPEAPQLADQALVLSTTEFVLDYYGTLIRNETFQTLIAKGVMLNTDLAIRFLQKVGRNLSNS
jgi:hypothetical protein